MAEIVHDEFLDSNVSAVWAAGAAGNYAACASDAGLAAAYEAVMTWLAARPELQ